MYTTDSELHLGASHNFIYMFLIRISTGDLCQLDTGIALLQN